MENFTKLKEEDPKGFFDSTKKTIESMTEVTNNHMLTPELILRVKSVNNPADINSEESPVPKPYWAYNWVGGQALTRYLLDNPDIIQNRSVLDVGSGCGALAIAAAKLGAASAVTANDIDPIAAVAIELNASLNSCKPNSITITTENLIKNKPMLYLKYDSLFLGDMFFYGKQNVEMLHWLVEEAVNRTLDVYFGDPIRDSPSMYLYRKHFQKIKTYKISDQDRDLNGLRYNYVYVYKMIPLKEKKKRDPFPNRMNPETGLCNLTD